MRYLSGRIGTHEGPVRDKPVCFPHKLVSEVAVKMSCGIIGFMSFVRD